MLRREGGIPHPLPKSLPTRRPAKSPRGHRSTTLSHVHRDHHSRSPTQIALDPVHGKSTIVFVLKKTIDFTEPQLKWLNAESKRLGLRIAELLRRLVDQARSGK